jgi:hypothetical protein
MEIQNKNNDATKSLIGIKVFEKNDSNIEYFKAMTNFYEFTSANLIFINNLTSYITHLSRTKKTES